jgi:spore coat polysaccharide biosynthesis protein SpsF
LSQKVVAIIQARMGSTRLPGKSLMPLAGKPLVYRVLERIIPSKNIDQIVLAIPDTKENQILSEIAHELGVSVFAGSEDDLVDRYYRAAEKFDARFVVRIPADNPTPQSSEIDKIIEHHLGLRTVGFSSNLAEVFGSRYPDGIGAEIFDFELLQESWKKESNSKKREHVHLNFFDYGTQIPVDFDWCPVSTVQCPEEFARPDVILDVNTLQQYRYMAQLYEDLYRKNARFSIQDIIAWHDKLKLFQSQPKDN